MNDCIGAPAREWLERYVDGTLPEPEQQTFEEHFFDCPRCLGEVEAVQAAREQLRRHPVSIAPRARVFTFPAMVSFGALAATLLIGWITLRMVRPPQPANTYAVVKPAPAPSGSQANQQVQVAQLADLHPPAYHAAVLRGAAEDSAFHRGMKRYAAGDFAGASKTLSQVPAESADKLAAQFYSGVCRMNAGDFAGAQKLLHHVAAAPDSPQQESAWYYLAQIALAQSNVSDGRQDLDRVISLRGDLESQARKQLSELPVQPGTK